MQPNIRLMNTNRENGGAFYVAPEDKTGLAYVLRELDAYRQEEPNSDWHLETQGTGASWHRANETDLRAQA